MLSKTLAKECIFSNATKAKAVYVCIDDFLSKLRKKSKTVKCSIENKNFSRRCRQNTSTFILDL